ncbi:hypothetical protein, partial [Paramuribaculum intestinale]|uniref:hypothetical protein n=1 Tax=Paramuribaculum intestinale TaxID=2094151 RepID=UPI0025B63075
HKSDSDIFCFDFRALAERRRRFHGALSGRDPQFRKNRGMKKAVHPYDTSGRRKVTSPPCFF